ncbi:TonB-dependent receptor [Flavobacterium noncentrifugens]|uniref:Outer membrane receptor proteins, mostly Fe transport n=1 Tax=Flavobacterium noncentrifugens TaxID=1128970 RepID=A0A1G8W7H5_9FLAO|nr:TonB-dependent receptor [Flavobacterium noncentrifugens]GEP50798.1 TonB-dependent receptor [Flavobacterium noncentrifugens]SDJ74047.1 Outer membrane receptor proteins, mostly Fe transport [Flavobacterium noncentrifugens]
MRTKFLAILSFFLIGSYGVSAQSKKTTVSGIIKDGTTQLALPFLNVIVKTASGNQFIAGTITAENGRFELSNLLNGNYTLELTVVGYKSQTIPLYIGELSEFLNVGTIQMEQATTALNEVTVSSKQQMINAKMDKKVFSVSDNITQSGGSVLQSMENLPGITVQDGKLQLRGNDKVMVLIDGKQTALAGFGNQSGLDNIPASAIDKIEIINNPSAKFDANGNAGVVNIIYKKSKQQGLNGKVSIGSGYGALWERKSNLPTIRPQYQMTPKINPSLSLTYRKSKINLFFQGDYLYTETLNKNEFATRTYDDGTIVHQQTKRNRNTHFTTLKSGFDWTLNDQNAVTVSGLFGSEKIIDHGDEPFFNGDYSQRMRLWQFVENELKTTAMASVSWQHKFEDPGHLLNAGINYTFHREDERYAFNNILPAFSGNDSFKLLSDEKVIDVNIDYVKPFKYGRIESGIKFRNREIPTNMKFFPGLNSPLDANAGGKATYKEIIPAVYGNYVYESPKIEAELGLRMEYVRLQYDVNPNHPTYKSDGYDYSEPFPNVRFAYKFNDKNKLSIFYNRRVDRPNEVDIRIFPKYDDAEIIKVGNPALRPQFTNSFELGFKRNIEKGYLFVSFYDKSVDNTIGRIAATAPGSNLIYAVFQNADESYSIGVETVFSKELASWYAMNLSGTVYQNTIDPFNVRILYPVENNFRVEKQQLVSGNVKSNNTFHVTKTFSGQMSAVWLAPDVIPQGKINSRFSVDLGIKKSIQKGKGEIFLNATDVLNTLTIRKEIQGTNFRYKSSDYYETQAVRFGYTYKF